MGDRMSHNFIPRPPAFVQYVTPSAGDTVTITGSANTTLLLNPAGTLLTLTIALPSSPVDGDRVQIGSSQIITTLSITGTIVGTMATIALGGFASFCYNSTANKWFRIG